MSRKNAYTCRKLHSTVTIDREKGVTPMFITCPECGERAVSRMYDLDNSIEPTHEWYLATEEEMINEAKMFHVANPDITVEEMLSALKEHNSKGGLSLRKIQS